MYLYVYYFFQGGAGWWHTPHGRLTGIKPVLPAEAAQSLNHWATREFPCI